MSDPFLSEIKIMAFPFPPKGWAQCEGQLMPISQNQALFSLLGTTYGGNGTTNFALPDLRGRVPLHWGAQFTLGQAGGEQAHTLAVAEVPMHTHSAYGSANAGDSPLATGNYLGAADNLYGPVAATTTLQPGTVTNAGGGLPHDNMQPYLALNFCIALVGIYPSRN
jgi:microcystin-dependent protein